MKSSVLLAKGILSETIKTGDQILMDCGRAAYTTARSVFHSKVFRLSQHIDRLFGSVSGLFPDEQAQLGITKEEIRESVFANVTMARNYLIEKYPAIINEKLDVKFSITIEKPTAEERLPMSVLILPMTRCHQPPITCDVYQVIRHNALVKDSLWVTQRDSYYKKSGKSVEEILLCDNDRIFEGGQSNFFAVKGDTVYTIGDGVLEGTVRTMVISLCKKLGIPLCLEAPRLGEIAQWDACFITSTSRFVMNVNTVRDDGKILREFDGKNIVVQKIINAIGDELAIESEDMF